MEYLILLIGTKVATTIIEFGLRNALLDLEVLDELLGWIDLHTASRLSEVATTRLKCLVVHLLICVDIVVSLHFSQACSHHLFVLAETNFAVFIKRETFFFNPPLALIGRAAYRARLHTLIDCAFEQCQSPSLERLDRLSNLWSNLFRRQSLTKQHPSPLGHDELVSGFTLLFARILWLFALFIDVHVLRWLEIANTALPPTIDQVCQELLRLFFVELECLRSSLCFRIEGCMLLFVCHNSLFLLIT